MLFLSDDAYRIIDGECAEVSQADHGKEYTIITEAPVEEGYIVRKKAD